MGIKLPVVLNPIKELPTPEKAMEWYPDATLIRPEAEMVAEFGRKYFVDRSFALINSKEVIIGFYEDKEFELASLFHELGHVYDPGPWRSKVEQETMAWNLGLEMAASQGIQFSKRAIRWSKKQLRSYYVRYDLFILLLYAIAGGLVGRCITDLILKS